MKLSKLTKNHVYFLSILAGTVLLFASAGPSNAAGAIEELETQVSAIEGIYDEIVPVAVGATVFGIGSKLVKRVAFS